MTKELPLLTQIVICQQEVRYTDEHTAELWRQYDLVPNDANKDIALNWTFRRERLHHKLGQLLERQQLMDGILCR